MDDLVIDAVEWYLDRGLIVTEPQLLARYKTLWTFLADEGLLAEGVEEAVQVDVSFQLRRSQLNEEGWLFIKRAHAKWLRAMDRGATDNGLSVLRKLRAGRSGEAM